MPDPERLRLLPKVDQILQSGRALHGFEIVPRAIVRRCVQEQIAALRSRFQNGGADGLPKTREAAEHWVERNVRSQLESLAAVSLRRVINATGVMLHTNLGRAPLSEAAIQAVVTTARGYVNLEYDLHAGARMSRLQHVDALLTQLCSAEAALAVNNNAAAVLLAIDTLGQNGVVVSRGEQIEIGDSFRLPEILAKSGVPIHEVGTTNRTSAQDYLSAASGPGCVFLKVHRSNFAVRGYTRDASLKELSEAARSCQATVVYDLGSGSLEEFEAHGLTGEPTVQWALAEGADIVTLSGDKLLGGPQAGIIAGRRGAIEAMRRNPLARALRIDKLTLAALQATLLSYLKDGAHDVPALRLILSQPEEIEARARRLCAQLQGRVDADVSVVRGRASVGGGSFADVDRPSFEVRLLPRGLRSTELLARLRQGTPAVVARIKDDFVGLDLCCVADDEVDLLAEAIEKGLAERGGAE